MIGRSGSRRSGVVAEFDAERGLGTISADGEDHPFHCASIADGSRDIEVGAAVRFTLIAKLGRYEAADIGP